MILQAPYCSKETFYTLTGVPSQRAHVSSHTETSDLHLLTWFKFVDRSFVLFWFLQGSLIYGLWFPPVAFPFSYFFYVSSIRIFYLFVTTFGFVLTFFKHGRVGSLKHDQISILYCFELFIQTLFVVKRNLFCLEGETENILINTQ